MQARLAAFYGTNSAGVRSPWRFCNLNNGGNAGLAGENGNNAPSNSNWNGRPRLYLFKVGILPDDMRLHIRAQAKISKTGAGDRNPRVLSRGLSSWQVVTRPGLL